METLPALLALSERLCAQFPTLGTSIVSVRPVRGGYLCKNYAVTFDAGQTYFLKYYRVDMNQFVGAVKDAEQHFAQAGIPVILPLRSDDGSVMFPIEDRAGIPVWASLYPFVDARMPTVGMSDVTIASLARTLAAMHVAGAGHGAKMHRLRFDVNTTQMYAEARRAIELAKQLPRSKIAKRLRSLLKRKMEFINHIRDGYTSAPALHATTMLHGDFQAQNTFVDAQGVVSHVYDFEHAAAGDPVFEMVRCLNLTCFERGFNERTFRQGHVFLSAYRELHPLSSEDLQRGMRAYLWHTAHKVRIENEYLFKRNTHVLAQLGPMEARSRYFAKGERKIRQFCERVESP